jgi:hypothetical protein
METVMFERAVVREHLDKLITYWRDRRDRESDPIAIYYIDAFQSVRTSLFGEILK